MDAESFRRIALGLQGAVEAAHMGHPDFRANGRIFATLQSDTRGMVKLPTDEQARLITEHPSMFEPESGAWGRQGCTRVLLQAATAEVLGEAMTLAWQHVMAQRPRRKARRNA